MFGLGRKKPNFVPLESESANAPKFTVFLRPESLMLNMDRRERERERERDLLGNNVHDGGVQGAAR